MKIFASGLQPKPDGLKLAAIPYLGVNVAYL